MTTDKRSYSQLYYPVEEFILMCWLDGTINDIEPEDEATLAATSSKYIHLEPAWGEINEDSYANAVARIVLDRVQERLPQWGTVYGEEVELSREYADIIHRDVVMLPQHLFTIDWASSAPGFSWPEAYYLSYLPGFDRFVVTVSRDSNDIYGYLDLAIGHFDANEPIEYGVKRIIEAHWKTSSDTDHARWESYVDGRVISEVTANEWADDIWAPEGETQPVSRIRDVTAEYEGKGFVIVGLSGFEPKDKPSKKPKTRLPHQSPWVD